MTDRGEQRAQLEALAYVMDALRQQEHRYRVKHWPVPASVAALVDEVGFRVSRRQQTTPDASRAEPGDGGSETRLMVRYEAAARMLDVSERTVQRLVREGSLPAVRFGGKTARIRVADLEAFTAGLPTQTEVA